MTTKNWGNMHLAQVTTTYSKFALHCNRHAIASQHYSVANEWRDDVIDIILISGRPYTGKRKIQTHSGLYQPAFC